VLNGAVMAFLNHSFFARAGRLLTQCHVLRHFALFTPCFQLKIQPGTETLRHLRPGKIKHARRPQHTARNRQQRRADKAQPLNTQWPDKIAQDATTGTRQTSFQAVQARPLQAGAGAQQ